jgi:hypothetical protein
VKIEGYTAEVDPLHRNNWPVRWEETGEVIGDVVEHITITLDGGEKPITKWSWRITDAEAERLGRFWVPLRRSLPHYDSHDDAFASLVEFHRIAVRALARVEARRSQS